MILYGASDHGKVIADILEANNLYDIVFWDDFSKDNVWKYAVSKPDFDIKPNEKMIISIGDNRIRKLIAEKLNKQLKFALAIHPSAVISKYTALDSGTVVMAGGIINSNSTIGKHVIINSCAVIEHDCKLDDFTHVSPNATLCGNVTTGEGTHIGAGAVVIQDIKIGRWATIGAGTVVIKDVPDYAVVVGNPGTVIKYNTPNNKL